MKATEQLRKEHSAVKTVLKVMGKIAGRLEGEKEVNPADLEKILEFLKIFVDKCHHAKEEDMLFIALQDSREHDTGSRVSALLMDHASGRQLIRNLTNGINEYKAGKLSAGPAIAKNMRSYITLLIQHMDIEDNVLFPMADRHLSETKQDELYRDFDRLEEEEIGPGKHEEFHKTIDYLKNTYLE